MVDNCSDKSVSVRKLLVQCLTDLLIHYPSHPELPKYWVQGVVPLLGDQEIKSQEKVLEVQFSQIVNYVLQQHSYKYFKSRKLQITNGLVVLLVFQLQDEIE